jgi:HSP20 family molecular chaperone IbpA
MNANSNLQKMMSDILVSTSPYIDYLLPVGRDVLSRFESKTSFPRMNFSENENALQVHIEVPGIEPNDINIELGNGYLVISYQKENKEENNNEVFSSYVTRYNSFNRKIKVYNSTKQEDVSARCVNGLLTISVKKSQNDQTNIGNKITILKC